MRKYVYAFLCFVFMMLISSFEVSAKEYDNENVNISFGDGNIFHMAYQSYDKYSVDENGKFYYDGLSYTLSETDKQNRYVLLEGEKLTLKDDILTGEVNHDFYAFPIILTMKTNKVYTFYQEVCFKYDSMQACLIDEGDVTDISYGSYAHSFYYGFLPFYDENITFEYIYFNFKFVNRNDSNDVMEINNFGFDTTKGDSIYYKDNFEYSVYDFGYDHEYDDKYYLHPYCFQTLDIGGDEAIIRSEACTNKLMFAFYLRRFDNSILARNYDFKFDIYVGENYQDVYRVNTNEIKIVESTDFYSYLAPFDGSFNTNESSLVYLPLTNIDYSLQDGLLEYTSFKFKISYTCIRNCEDSRKENGVIENTYFIDIDDPKNISSVVEGIKLPNYYTFANNDTLVVKAEFSDHNGIAELGYFISSNYNETNLNEKSYISINNGENISIDREEGIHYIYFRVKTNSSADYVYYRQEFVIDKTAPEMVSNNFNEYKQNTPYNNINITITCEDEYLEIPERNIQSTIYYKVITESEKEGLTTQDVIDSNIYINTVNLNKTNISNDGKYFVCFVLKDFVDNYSEVICSNLYYIDVTDLTKQEVSATSVEQYQKEVKTTISIVGLSDGVSFRCSLSKVELTSEEELNNNCYNNKEAKLYVDDESIYKLWIYASDAAGNYSLLKLDNNYYVDSKAPRITTEIVGNNEVYSNDVKIIVNVFDREEGSIDLDKLSYEFYLATYDETKFNKFNKDEGISYPYDYYGSYKLAIKVCDDALNCKVYTSNESYLIDTAKIVLEFIGNKNITILQYQKYKELGVIATKGNAGKNSVNVEYKIEGEVDYKTPGKYKIIYTAGSGIGKVSVEREVIVKESKYYIIGLVSLFVIGEIIIFARLFIKRRKNDNI